MKLSYYILNKENLFSENNPGGFSKEEVEAEIVRRIELNEEFIVIAGVEVEPSIRACVDLPKLENVLGRLK